MTTVMIHSMHDVTDKHNSVFVQDTAVFVFAFTRSPITERN